MWQVVRPPAAAGAWRRFQLSRLSRKTACSPNRFQNHQGAFRRSGVPQALSATAFSIFTPISPQSCTKSLMVQWWILGVSYQLIGQDIGVRHVAGEQQLQAHLPVAEIRKRDDGMAADAQHVLEHHARVARGLQRLRQDHEVEGVVRIVGEIGVGVALDHRQALGHAFVDALARQFDAAAVDAAGLRQQPQQLAVAAADVEHLGAALDHVGDQHQVDAGAAGVRAILATSVGIG